jgi:hypothetical protein
MHSLIEWIKQQPQQVVMILGTILAGLLAIIAGLFTIIFVIFREQHGHPVIDLMEPHRGEDSLAKVHGLCKFAEDHGDHFGKIEWIRIEGKQIQRLNVNSPAVRKEVLAANVDGALDSLFKTVGTHEHIPF